MSHIMIYTNNNTIKMQDAVFNEMLPSYPNITCPYRAPELCPAGAEAIVGNIVVLFGLVVLAILML